MDVGIEENKVAARRNVEEFLNGRNAAVVDELASEGFVDHQGGGSDITGGREDVKQFVNTFLSAFEDLRFEIEHLVAEGDLVCIHLIARGTHTGEFREITATGRRVEIGGISLVRFEDGKMAERWNIVDLPGLMQQIGG